MGIGSSVSKNELEEMATNPYRDVFVVKSFKSLTPKIQEIVDTVCFAGKLFCHCFFGTFFVRVEFDVAQIF